MNKIIPLIITFFMYSCAPISVVTDRYDNQQDKTVAIMKVQKKDGMKDSTIVELLTYYANGQLASSTYMKRNARHGKHIAYSPSGDIIEKGNFEQNRKSNKWSWFGKDGEPDSSKSFEKGMLSGKSVNYSETGNKIHEMSYQNHKYHGKSIHYNDNGEKSLIGEYRFGIPHGKWTWFNSSGKKERIVSYRSGIKEGSVTIWNDEGKKVMTGSYINDKKNGEWKWHSDDKGLDSLIEYSNDQYMGKYKVWHVNGEKAAVGTYQNDVKTGEWKWYSINGNLDSTKSYTNGILNGLVQFYYSNGKTESKSINRLEDIFFIVKEKIIPGENYIKSKMTYANSKLHGEKIDYYSNGQKRSSWIYDMGIRSGKYTKWNTNGFKRESGTYLNDKLNGINFRRYHHGEYSTITTFSNGQIHGIMRMYSPSGVIKKEEYYYLGQLQCSLEYFDNTRLKEIIVYRNLEVVFQKNWNNLGLETTRENLKKGVTTKTERFDSGNLQSETSLKGNELHGLSWAFLEDNSLEYLSLYIEGKHVFRRQYLLDKGGHKDYLFPASELQVIVKIDLEEI